MHTNYIEHDETPPEDESIFACACGDDTCKGRDDDSGNVNVQGTWYAAECEVGRTRKLIELAGDVFNLVRR